MLRLQKDAWGVWPQCSFVSQGWGSAERNLLAREFMSQKMLFSGGGRGGGEAELFHEPHWWGGITAAKC